MEDRTRGARQFQGYDYDSLGMTIGGGCRRVDSAQGGGVFEGAGGWEADVWG